MRPLDLPLDAFMLLDVWETAREMAGAGLVATRGARADDVDMYRDGLGLEKAVSSATGWPMRDVVYEQEDLGHPWDFDGPLGLIDVKKSNRYQSGAWCQEATLEDDWIYLVGYEIPRLEAVRFLGGLWGHEIRARGQRPLRPFSFRSEEAERRFDRTQPLNFIARAPWTLDPREVLGL